MKNLLHIKYTSAQYALNFIWILFTTLFLVFAIYYQWHQYALQKQLQLKSIANFAGFKIDLLFDKLLDNANALPLYGPQLADCNQSLRPLFKRIVFNTPQIVGVDIRAKNNKLICSTMESKYQLPSSSAQSPALIGPLNNANNSKTFLLQKQVGQYYFGVYIPEKVLTNALKSTSSDIQFIALYNRLEKKIILQVGESPLSEKISLLGEGFVKVLLEKLDNYNLIIAAQTKQFNKDFFYRQLINLLGLILIPFLLYLKLSNLLSKRFSLKYALKQAIKGKQFYHLYQPIMDIEQGIYCGAEVLIRWQTDSDEIIMPDTFIYEAEQSGLIIPITLQLVETVFSECHALLNKYPDFHLAFNLSVSHFEENSFLEQFNNLCRQNNIPPRQIMIELTERQLLDQHDRPLVKNIQKLRTLGYSLAIDDFGTGHASINYLQHFPFNYLKIDKLFIHAIGTGAINETLNEAIIHMANCLHLHIIAEGVETKQQFEFLRASHIHLMQGWYFAKAMSYQELVKSLEKDQG